MFSRGTSNVALTTIDRISGGPCTVSQDGFVHYALPSTTIPAIDFTSITCTAPANGSAETQPPLPSWAHPSGPTQAIFVATSLQEAYSQAGLRDMEGIAAGAGVPMTWMIGNDEYISSNAALYNQYHASNGDDVEVEASTQLADDAMTAFPWYSPAVLVAGAGSNRNVAAAPAFGDTAFWGITWNSHGTDSTSDEGAPWGTFCADPTSYKQPTADGSCALLSFEWTARDLTRAYLGDTGSKGYSAEAAFSTDPDDVRIRGEFSGGSGDAYVRAMMDAYAAAGVTQPIVVMSQQESHDEATNAAVDDPILQALYQEAVASGMKPMTMRQALPLAKQFSAQPRAIAFPFIPGGMTTTYNGVPFTPATIDFHDNVAGMTFIAGHTIPSRVFEYASETSSSTRVPLPQIDASSAQYPRLTGVTPTNGGLQFAFTSPQAMHFGVAIWADPSVSTFTGTNVTQAGHAGSVITFDLPAGTSTQFVPCANCNSTTFSYSV